MKKLITIGIGGVVLALLAVAIFIYVRTPVTEYAFANNGDLMCVTRKADGMFGVGDTTCFGISKISNDFQKLQMTVQQLDSNGEIILKKN